MFRRIESPSDSVWSLNVDNGKFDKLEGIEGGVLGNGIYFNHRSPIKASTLAPGEENRKQGEGDRKRRGIYLFRKNGCSLLKSFKSLPCRLELPF